LSKIEKGTGVNQFQSVIYAVMQNSLVSFRRIISTKAAENLPINVTTPFKTTP